MCAGTRATRAASGMGNATCGSAAKTRRHRRTRKAGVVSGAVIPNTSRVENRVIVRNKPRRGGFVVPELHAAWVAVRNLAARPQKYVLWRRSQLTAIGFRFMTSLKWIRARVIECTI